MSEERMRHRIWAEQDQYERWVGHFQTSRGIRKVPIEYGSKDEALIAAGSAMCQMLDAETIRIPVLPARGTKAFAVTKTGRNRVRLSAIG